MKEFQTSRLESQRYLWGPGAVGSTPAVKPLTGLGFEVFSTGKEKVMESRDVQDELAVMIGMLLFGGGLDSR
jgi:hypothetical protein